MGTQDSSRIVQQNHMHRLRAPGGSSLPAQKQVHTPFKLPDSHSNRFLLLNDLGRPLREFYIQIITPPRGATIVGRARYIDGRGTSDDISFRFSEDGKTLRAWHSNSPKQRFTISPYLHNGELAGLKIHFSNGSTAYFAKELVDFDFEIKDSVIEKCLDAIWF